MKKIIELAEKVCSTEGFVDDNILLAIEDLDRELVSRKTLEQTPITEDWLKEHGWRKTGKPYEWQCGIWVQKWNLINWQKGDFEIFDTPKYDGYTWKGIMLTSVAKLLDALELCGIEMED